jgi:hypothetical protein
MKQDPSKWIFVIAGLFAAAAVLSAASQPAPELGGQYRTFAVLATIAALLMLTAIFVRVGRDKD